MNYYEDISAVVLAGGKNSRFQGKIKSLALLHSHPLIIHQLENLKKVFKRIIIISNTKNLLREYTDVPVYEDIYKEKGPLGGIYTGMFYANTKYAFIFGGDMPFLSEELIREQINLLNTHKPEIIIPQTIKGIEPLHSIYETQLHKRLQKMLSESGIQSIRNLFAIADTYYWHINDQNAFININTPEELAYYNSKEKIQNKATRKNGQ